MPGKYLIHIGWDEVPHLDEQAKKELADAIPPWQLEARTKGVPQLGAGAIFPIAESEIRVKPFPIPDFWPRAFSMDVGWKVTCALWWARDPETGISYAYGEYYRSQAEPAAHAAAIRSRGKWINGVIDPAARGRSQVDGQELLRTYREMGLKITPAKNAVEAGLVACWQLMSAGQLKVFDSCLNFFDEYRLYRRNEKGDIVKKKDHLMDAMRYYVLSGRDRMTVNPKHKKSEDDEPRYMNTVGMNDGWMG